ncbi:hypothetical protein ACMBCN_03605 [Candidatus Liberibacter asiaticus]|nr:hypothetical protein [Candidatus Liberibacter asiaticus]
MGNETSSKPIVVSRFRLLIVIKYFFFFFFFFFFSSLKCMLDYICL